MVKKRQILVIGHNTNGCTPEHEKVAYDVGMEIAKSDSVLITGGLGGVMTAAAHGAKDAGGLTVGIIPQADASEANEYCDIVIPTGMGLTRDFLNALTADG
ncbi:MAG: TIGR00725 family protein, partial [Nitrosopumilus sp.]